MTRSFGGRSQTQVVWRNGGRQIKRVRRSRGESWESRKQEGGTGTAITNGGTGSMRRGDNDLSAGIVKRQIGKNGIQRGEDAAWWFIRMNEGLPAECGMKRPVNRTPKGMREWAQILLRDMNG